MATALPQSFGINAAIDSKGLKLSAPMRDLLEDVCHDWRHPILFSNSSVGKDYRETRDAGDAIGDA